MRHRLPVLLVALSALALPSAGCTPLGVAVGAGATVGVAAAEERGVGGTARDVNIRLAINDAWIQRDFGMYQALRLQIYEGRVLVTGSLQDQTLKDDAIRLAWQPAGVREVIDEVEVRRAGGVEEFARDSWIVTQLKAKLLFDAAVLSINYSLEASGGTVYLIGLAQDQAELERVQEIARTTPYVKKVVSYVLIKGDARRKA